MFVFLAVKGYRVTERMTPTMWTKTMSWTIWMTITNLDLMMVNISSVYPIFP